MINDFSRYRDLAFKDADTIGKTRKTLLKRHLGHCAKNSCYYRRVFASSGIRPEDVDPDSLSMLPFTEKSDIARSDNEFLAVPAERIVDIVFSSGSTGEPISVKYTEHDLVRLAYNEAQAMRGCGISDRDVVILTCTMDRCFVAGLAYFLGARSIGAASVRSGNNSMEGHISVIKRVRPTVIVGVPSFLKKLGYYMRQNIGIDPGTIDVKKLVCIGDPLRDREMRSLSIAETLSDLWQAELYSTYASSETITTFCECTASNGGHLQPELAVIEIVDERGRNVPDGTAGEVVVTPMGVEGMPLVRFKTGDISFLLNGPCACGRSTSRLGPILGRKNQMMKIKGTTIYPQAVCDILDGIGEVQEYFLDVTRSDDLSDILTVHASVSESSCTADFIQKMMQARLRVKPIVMIGPLALLKNAVYPENARKPLRFIDKRGIK